MKQMIFIAILITLTSVECKKEDLKEIPECIVTHINAIKEAKVWNPPARLYRYQYKGQTVYYFPPRCCDIPSTLFNAECNVICAPDGGFTGKGNGGCPDFSKERSEEELLWEDKREYP